jgi:hypothetical protein
MDFDDKIKNSAKGASRMVKKMFFAFAAMCIFLSVPCLAAGPEDINGGFITAIRTFNDPTYGFQNCAYIHVHYTTGVFGTGVYFGATGSCPSVSDWYYTLDLSTPGGQGAYAVALTAYSLNKRVFVQLLNAYQSSYCSTNGAIGIPICGITMGDAAF